VIEPADRPQTTVKRVALCCLLSNAPVVMRSPHMLLVLSIASAVLAHEASADRSIAAAGTHAHRMLYATTMCSDDCFNLTNDGICDDGGSGAEFSVCSGGRDCEDCGPRHVLVANATNETSPLTLVPASYTEAINTGTQSDQLSSETRTNLILLAVFVGVLGLVCIFFICYLRGRKTPKNATTADATKVANASVAASSDATDDDEGEVAGGFGGGGDAYGSDAVGSALKEDERRSSVRENDVRMAVAESFEVESMASKNEPYPVKTDDDGDATPKNKPYPVSTDEDGDANAMTDGKVVAAKDLDSIDAVDTCVDEGGVAAETPMGEDETSAVAPSPSADAFVKALRAGLGLDTALTPREGRSAADLSFDTAVEMELRTLFQRCDTDSSHTMGRAEFTRALRILNLDKHLQKYGGDHGVVGGMEQLFRDLQTSSEADSINEEQFVMLFRKLFEAQQAPKPEPPPRRRAPAKLEGKSSFEMYEEREQHEYEDEMALALERANNPLHRAMQRVTSSAASYSDA